MAKNCELFSQIAPSKMFDKTPDTHLGLRTCGRLFVDSINVEEVFKNNKTI